MAQQSAVKRTDIAENGAGKLPRSSGKAGKSFDYSKWRQNFRDERVFESFLAGYPDKTGILGYVYRIKPAIDMSMIAVNENSIFKTSKVSEMTSEFIGSKFRRGRYMLKLTDANRPKGMTQIATTWFECDDPELGAPQYDIRTLKLGDPENLDEIQRLLSLGQLVRDPGTGMPRLRTENDGASAAASAQTVHHHSETPFFEKEIVGKIVAHALSNVGGVSPDTQMRSVIEMAKLMQQPSGGISAQEVREIISQTMERGTRGNGDLFENYEKIQTFVSRFGGGVTGPTESTLGTVRAIVGDLVTAVPAIIGGVLQLQEKREEAALRRQQGYNRPMSNGSPQQPQQPQQVAPPEPSEIPLTQRIEQIAVLGFQKMREGVSGEEFASYAYYFIDGGDEVFELLSEQGGTQAVMALAAMSPAAREYVKADRAAVQTFLDQFFSFVPDPAGQEPAEEAQAAHA